MNGFGYRLKWLDCVRTNASLLRRPVPSKWLREDSPQAEFFWIAKGFDSEGSSVMAIAGLGSVGAENSVPPWKIETEVTVGFVAMDRVMHAMHIRGHNQPAQDWFEPGRDANVGVVEQRGGVEEDFEEQDCQRRRSQGGDYSELDHHRQGNLDWVETVAGGCVNVEIRMMHAVQAPKDRDAVEDPMLKVNGEIEQDDRNDNLEPRWPGEGIK